MYFGRVTLEEMFVSKCLAAIGVRTHIIPSTKMGDIVVRGKRLFGLERLGTSLHLADPIPTYLSPSPPLRGPLVCPDGMFQ